MCRNPFGSQVYSDMICVFCNEDYDIIVAIPSEVRSILTIVKNQVNIDVSGRNPFGSQVYSDRTEKDKKKIRRIHKSQSLRKSGLF